jgi:DNA-directed RNA polymerase specialized sigma24 family protein
MDAHEYLSLYLALNRDIERWRRLREKTLEFNPTDTRGLEPLLRGTANYSGMPPAHTQHDRMAEVVGDKVDRELQRHRRHYDENIDHALARQIAVAEAIDCVPVSACRQLLDLKYLQGLTLDDICDTARVSKNTARKYIKQGLQCIVVPAEVELEGRAQSPAAAA